MRVSDAKALLCPFLGANCECEACMFWVTTVNGKKVVSTFKMPYDIYPSEQGQRHRQLINDGYVEERLSGETRSTYIKYEESYEGYCLKAVQ